MCVCPNRTTSFLADVGDSLRPTFISWPHPRPAVGSALWDHLVFVLFQTLGRSSKAGRKAANRGLNKQFSGESQLKNRKDSSRLKDVMFLGAEQEWFFFKLQYYTFKIFCSLQTERERKHIQMWSLCKGTRGGETNQSMWQRKKDRKCEVRHGGAKTRTTK